MIVQIDKSFAKDLQRIHDQRLRKRIANCIIQITHADSPGQINYLKRIKGEISYYRIRFGDYRLGLKMESNRVILIRFLHRKEIYNYFP